MENLLTKFRPRTLAEVLGQPAIVRSLSQYVRHPHPAAFLFGGETGTGKTSTAFALARELGVAVDEAELGGLYEIPSGELGADLVRAVFRQLHFRPLMGTGWRMLVCNEAELMSRAAEIIWLDQLEKLPSSSVVIFTTNRPEQLSPRFRDRCEGFAFRSKIEDLRPALRELACKVWSAEVGVGEPPLLETLGLPAPGDVTALHASFRLALQQLAPLVRAAVPLREPGVSAHPGAARSGRQPAAKKRRQQSLPSRGYLVECDHCHREQSVVAGTAETVCVYCKQSFGVEWGEVPTV